MTDSIIRGDVNDDFAYSGWVRAGDFIFLSFCVGNVGDTIEQQVEGALNDMARRLEQNGLTLESVVQVTVLLKDPWNIPIMEQVFQRRFRGKYPARKTVSTEFAHVGGVAGLQVQIDGIAWYSRNNN